MYLCMCVNKWINVWRVLVINIIKLQLYANKVVFCQETFQGCVWCDYKCTREVQQYENFSPQFLPVI
jgi:hypothetical protein